ncbi:MgtC/SapB family protein [Pelagibius sp. 7325]|uniref:MgtC/SapB family protein n=1 Tax=Pelagibius sp. 7325 TaxID=3131994 RepID=UPI0030EEB90E
MFDAISPHLLQTNTPVLEIVSRLTLAIVFGGTLGLDRELRQKAAGLRTHILVSLAAAIFTLITFEIFFEMNELMAEPRSDAIRIIEAVTAGVAFLAAGTIIQSGGTVQGLTTGASMWLAGAIGLACGGGFYIIAVIGTLLALVVLYLLGKVEARLLPGDDD